MRLRNLSVAAAGALEPFRRRKWIVVQLVLLGALAGALLTVEQQRRYEGTASVLQIGRGAVAGDLQLARSARVVDVALREPVAREIGRASFVDHSSATARSGSDTVELHVTDVSPARAAALATAYAQAYAAVRRGLAGGGRASELVTPAGRAEQVSPRPVRTIAEGMAGGAVLAVLLISLLEALDTRIRKPEHVSRALDLPLLGTVPASAVPPDGSLILRAAPYGEGAEAYRIVRSNLELAAFDGSTQAIMVTSALDGEGRTTTAANLALACALEGRRVVLVDLTLRYPALARRFGLEGRPGLTDVVQSHLLLGATLIPVGLDQEASHRPPVGAAGELDLLLAGPEPVDTAEVIDSDAVADLVGELRERYDLVFLDAPPLLPVGDARILSRIADAMVVVANLSVLRKPLLNQLRSAIRACAAPPLGIVATGVKLSRREAYAGYYYERRVGHMRRATREWAA